MPKVKNKLVIENEKTISQALNKDKLLSGPNNLKRFVVNNKVATCPTSDIYNNPVTYTNPKNTSRIWVLNVNNKTAILYPSKFSLRKGKYGMKINPKSFIHGPPWGRRGAPPGGV